MMVPNVPNAYQVLHQGAGLIPRSDRGRLVFEGVDRADYLQGLLTNDVLALAPGTGCYATYLTPQGRIIADVEVLNVGDRLLLDVHLDVRAMLVDRFRELVFTEDVQIEDWTDTWTGFAVVGPLAESSVRIAVGAFLGVEGAMPATLADHECLAASSAGGALVLARTDPFGGRGLDLWVEQAAAAPLREALLRAGCTEIDVASAEVVRIEAGRPTFPTDLVGEVIPLEAGIESRAISTTKGCYVGQEVIVRVLHRGQGRVARLLTGLTMPELVAPSPCPEAGAVLWHGDDRVGHMTSIAFSPKVGSIIGLGFVSRGLLDPGTALAVEVKGQRRTAVVTQLPFVVTDP